jgi:Mg2+-importing ATPase
VLVIFVLRTRRNPLRSRPHPLLATTSAAVVVIAVLLPFMTLGAWFGFVTPSAAFLFAIAGLSVSTHCSPRARNGRLPRVGAGRRRARAAPAIAPAADRRM